MTVLDGKQASGFDLRQLGRILVTALLVGVIAAGVVLAITNDPPAVPAAAAEAEAAAADVIHFQNAPAVAQAGDIAVAARADLIHFQNGADRSQVDKADLKFLP